MTTKREKADAWMPFFVGDYLADTTHLSRDQHGGYLLLLFAMWKGGGRLSDDDEQLANIVKATSREWRALRPRLAPFFVVGDGIWRHKRIAKELAGATERKAKAVQKAELGAKARWGKPVDNNASSNALGNAPSNATSIGQAMLNECPPPSPIYKPVVTPTVPREKNRQGVGQNGLARQKHRGNGAAAWKTDDRAADDRAKKLGISAHPGESYEALRDRITIAERKAQR